MSSTGPTTTAPSSSGLRMTLRPRRGATAAPVVPRPISSRRIGNKPQLVEVLVEAAPEPEVVVDFVEPVVETEISIAHEEFVPETPPPPAAAAHDEFVPQTPPPAVHSEPSSPRSPFACECAPFSPCECAPFSPCECGPHSPAYAPFSPCFAPTSPLAQSLYSLLPEPESAPASPERSPSASQLLSMYEPVQLPAAQPDDDELTNELPAPMPRAPRVIMVDDEDDEESIEIHVRPSDLPAAKRVQREEPERPQLFSYYVKTLTGKSLELKMAPTNTILQAKKQVTYLDGIPADQQRMIFAHSQLRDELTLAECGIEPGQTIHVVLRLRGAMFHKSSGRADENFIQLYVSCEPPLFKPTRINKDIKGKTLYELVHELISAARDGIVTPFEEMDHMIAIIDGNQHALDDTLVSDIEFIDGSMSLIVVN